MHAEFDKMPVVVDTFGLRMKNDSLCKQLEQLKAAEKVFSRRKVIVDDEEAAEEAPPSAEEMMPTDEAAPAAASTEPAVDITDL